MDALGEDDGVVFCLLSLVAVRFINTEFIVILLSKSCTELACPIRNINANELSHLQNPLLID